MSFYLRKRIVLLLFSVTLLVFIYFGFGPIYEGFYFKEIVEINELQTIGIKGLPKIHDIMKTSYSIKTKRIAVSVIKDIGSEKSIPVLINEFKYRGRWWVRWWDYEETFDVDAYHSYVSVILSNYGKNTKKYLLRALKGDDENVRYWAVVTLCNLKWFSNWQVIEYIAEKDTNQKVRERAKWELEHK